MQYFNSKVVFVLLIGLLAVTPSFAQLSLFLDYLYLTDTEESEYEEILWFWTPDTFYGNVHSNGIFSIQYAPIFAQGYFSTVADTFNTYFSCHPYFEFPPRFNVPEVVLPQAFPLPEQASVQGHYFDNENFTLSFLCEGGSDGWDIAAVSANIPPDSADTVYTELIPYSRDLAIYFNGELRIQGTEILGITSIGASGDIYLTDDLLYAGSDQSGIWIDVPDTCTSLLGLLGEADVFIANTWANGRGNGVERNYWEADSANICITAAVLAMSESFQIEDLNNPGDEYYWCDPEGDHPNSEDNRGEIKIFGSLVQTRHGMTRNSNCGHTGYSGQRYEYDSRFHDDPPPFLYSFTEINESTTWQDTTVCCEGPVLVRNSILTLGVNTTIQVNGSLENLFYLMNNGGIRINGTAEEPVRIELDASIHDLIFVTEDDSIVDGFGILTDEEWNGLAIEGSINTHLQMTTTGKLIDCAFRRGALTLQPHPDLEFDEENPYEVTSFVFDGQTMEALLPEDTPSLLDHAEIHGILINRFQTIRNATFAANILFAVQNLNPQLFVSNTFFFGYYGILIDGVQSEIAYSGYGGFLGETPFGESVSVGQHMLNDVDPLFVDPENGNYHLLEGSPLIDAGDPFSPYDPDGTIADIGAYPFDWTAVPGSDGSGEEAPVHFGIAGIHPNPCNSSTRLQVMLAHPGEMKITLHDLLGRTVRTIYQGYQSAGSHEHTFSMEDLPSGTYFLALWAQEMRAVEKIILLK